MAPSITFELHPDAAKSFNEKAEALIPLVGAVPVAGQQEGFQLQIHPRARIGEKDIIGEIEFGIADSHGKEVGRAFGQGGETFGLVGQGFRDMVALATRLQQVKSIRPYVSVRCLINAAFHWVKDRYRGASKESFTDHVLRECAQRVETVEIWIPLFSVYIETEFSVGKVRFKTLTREMFDNYQQRVLDKVPEENRVAAKVELERERSRFQGCAAATIEVIAEPLRAGEIAAEEADYAIAALRFFHPANGTPFFRSFCTVNGTENLSVSSLITVREGVINQWAKSSNLGVGSAWALPHRDIAMFQKAGLEALGSLLAKRDRSPFENDLLDAFLIYSRNSLFDDLVNRLVHILAAVESLLLRENNEPIQKNIGERLAFVVGITAEERMAIRDNVTQVYGLRSAFLHHGHALDEMEALEVFMQNAWIGFLALIHDSDRYIAKEELIAALERRKME